MTNPGGNTTPTGNVQPQGSTRQGQASSGQSQGSGNQMVPTMTPTTTSTQTSSTTTGGANNIMVVLGGETIEYNPSGIAVQKLEAFYKKQDREPMAPDKKAALFDKATKPGLTAKFDLKLATFSDEDKLDDTYSIGILVNRFKAHCIKYGMHDVMNVVHLQPNKPDEPTGVRSNLFERYSRVPELTVAESCEWFRKYMVPNYYRENLPLVNEALENSCTEQLWEKCVEAHDEYPVDQRGGPLSFSIMMQLLQSHSDNAVPYPINSVKNLKISGYDGENVSKVVSLIQGVYKG
jgi:hypothetical protein